jgi:hypothetical protein
MYIHGLSNEALRSLGDQCHLSEAESNYAPDERNTQSFKKWEGYRL